MLGGGAAYTEATLERHGLGGSEIEVLQVARGLTDRGYQVTVANGIETACNERGIAYVPNADAWAHPPRRALYLQRVNTPDPRMTLADDVRVVVRANDLHMPCYDVHRERLQSGRAAVVANTHWQGTSFTDAREVLVVSPMLEPIPCIAKEPGLFVFASGAEKGWGHTLSLWCALKDKYRAFGAARLVAVAPGWGEPTVDPELAARYQVEVVGSPPPAEYRAWIARAEGIFMVNLTEEAFGCIGAFAERVGTRTHILCPRGIGGFIESVQDRRYIQTEPSALTADVLSALGQPPIYRDDLPDLTPAAIMPQWEAALRLTH